MRMAISGFTLGQFLPGNTALHRGDARAKLVAALLIGISLFLVRGWLGLALLACGLAAGFGVARVPPRYLWRGIRPLALLLLVTFVIQALSLPGEPLVRLGPFAVTKEGMEEGAFVTIRLSLLLLISVLLTVTTAPVALTDGLESLLRPLAWFRIPTYEIALMMTIALRFIPTLVRELDQLIKAQRVRGADLTTRSPRRLARALLPLVVPLFVLSFRKADDLAVAMVSRCYRGGEARSRYRDLRFQGGDVLLLVLTAAVLGTALSAGRLWSVGW